MSMMSFDRIVSAVRTLPSGSSQNARAIKACKTRVCQASQKLDADVLKLIVNSIPLVDEVPTYGIPATRP